MPGSRYELALGRHPSPDEDLTAPRPDRSVDVQITPKQRTFLQATTRGRIYCGGVGSGKSRILCYWSILKALAGKRGALVSFSYRNILDVLVHTMFESMASFGFEPGRDYAFWKGDMAFTLAGSEIMLRSADDPNRLRGLNLHYFGLDEGREFPDDEVFNVLIGRLRNSETDEWAISSTSMGRNWFWKIAQSEGLEGAFESGHGANEKLTVIVQSSWENTFLPQAYLQELQHRYSEQLAQQELYGRIVDFSAGIFHRAWFKTGPYFKPDTGVRSWDLASSMNSWSDYTVGALLARKDGVTWITDVVRTKVLDLVNLIVETALLDGPGVVVAIESNAMQAAVAGSITGDARMARYRVVAYKPDRDKYARAVPLTSRLEQGTLRLCEASWNQALIDEFCTFTPEERGQHDDQVDSISQGYLVLNRDPMVKSPPPGGPYAWPDPANPEEAKLVQTLAAVELKDYEAFVLTARWHPIHAELEITSASRHKSVADLAAAVKSCRRRFASEDLDSAEFKSVATALGRERAPVVTGKLDPAGSIYEWNRLVGAGKVMACPAAAVLLAELQAATPDDLTPYVRCALRLAQEVRAIKREMPRPLRPFERQRREFREKQARGKAKEEGWVG